MARPKSNDEAAPGGRNLRNKYRGYLMEKAFTTLLIILDIAAALMYVPAGDWRHIIYWTAAAVLTFTVTF